MRKQSCLLVLVIFCLLTVPAVEAKGKVEIICPPVEETVIGLGFSYDLEPPVLHAAAGYDFRYDEFYYRLGTVWHPSNLKFHLNYSYWANYKLRTYIYQRGWEAGITRQIPREQNLQLSLFDGVVGRTLEDEVGTTYLHLGYDRFFPFAWEKETKKEIDLYLELVSGRVKKTGAGFFVTSLALPVKINNFRFTPYLGYLKLANPLEPYFDLSTFVRGYREKERVGDRAVSVTIEQQFPLFPDSDIRPLNLLRASFFADLGDVLPAGESMAAYALKTTAGAGLLLSFGEAELRLEAVVNERGEWSALFYFDTLGNK